MFCVSTTADKLIKEWTDYAVTVGNTQDTDRLFSEACSTIGHQQFVKCGLIDGLDIQQINDCWDMVKLNLNAIRN